MKSINLKQAVPVMVFALAIAGAFTTSAMEKSRRAVADVDAYKRLNPAGLCDEEKFTCSTENGQFVELIITFQRHHNFGLKMQTDLVPLKFIDLINNCKCSSKELHLFFDKIYSL